MEYYDVVKKLLGEIKPVGETYEDTRRFENLKNTISLVDDLISDLQVVATNKDRVEYSMKQAGLLADKFLQGLKESK
ncbi:MAG: hypothetical protein WC444_07145 [Candidatus Paceibacterota bacterium]